jgi:predicted metal-dependent hydrolase
MRNTISNPPVARYPVAMAAGKPGSVGPLKRLKVGDRFIEYRIRRSRQRKKTYQVSIVSGEVVLAVPYRTTNGQAEDMVRQKAEWILAKLDLAPAKPEAPAFLSGEKLPYRGSDLTLWVQGVAATATGQPEVSRERRRLKVSVPLGLDDTIRPQQIEAALMTWYAHRAGEQVDEYLAQWLPVLGNGTVPTVRIRNQKRRWGSCSHTGNLRFNWRLAMLEPALTEYVVVHELCHLTHMNHSADFWALVARHLPDVKERRRRLRELEAALPSL